jgi:SAM-dependent methyltransferase
VNFLIYEKMSNNRLANKFNASEWFRSPALNRFVKAEAKQLSRALRLARGPNVLFIGEADYARKLLNLDFPVSVRVLSDNRFIENQDKASLSTPIKQDDSANAGATIVYADASFLPFPEDSFQTIILAHALENNELPHQVLREANRVLSADGHIIIAGFNPLSLFNLQYKLRFKNHYLGKLYSLYRTKDWLKVLGFETVGSAMFQYSPISSGRTKTGAKKPRRISRILESVGDRWFPMFGGAYVLVAKKRTFGVRLKAVPSRLSSRKRRLVSAGANKVIKLNKRTKD